MTAHGEGPEMPVIWRDVVPGMLGVYAPTDPDDLLERLTEEESRATDDRLPYFATLWPAGEALARAVLAGASLEGVRILDLGCGVGVVGLAAAVRGAHVTFLDWESRSLALVERSARRLGAEPAALVSADWRTPPSDLGRFRRILGADVLYEERNVAAVAAFLAGHLEAGAEAWLADPRRDPAVRFPSAARKAGLRVAAPSTLAARPRGVEVRLFRVILPGEAP